ncbi:MAG: hypothetical protein OXN84_11375, partial [Albidovulum sp.]|nr:hypothetical protein [Albidovulum sp.]
CTRCADRPPVSRDELERAGTGLHPWSVALDVAQASDGRIKTPSTRPVEASGLLPPAMGVDDVRRVHRSLHPDRS